MRTPTVVAQWPVITETHRLTVSTVKLGFRSYETAIFDDSSDKRHAGQSVGGFVVDSLVVRSDDRTTAMAVHREAHLAVRNAAGGAA